MSGSTSPPIVRVSLSLREILIFVGLYIALVGVGATSLLIYQNNIFTVAPNIIWPPLGLAIAAATLIGYAALIPIGLAALTIALIYGAPPLMLAYIVVGNIAQAGLAAFFLRRIGFNPRLEQLHDIVALLATSFFASMILPTFRAFATLVSNAYEGTTSPILWGTWWVGGALSIVALAPLVFMVSARPVRQWLPSGFSWLAALELVAVNLLIIGALAVPFLGWHIDGSILILPLILALGWVALRCGLAATAFSLLLTTVMTFAIALGTTDPMGRDTATRLFGTQLFDLFIAAVFFLIAGLAEQRRSAVDSVRSYTERLERSLEESRRAEESKNEFIAILAHELRNPLALLENSAQLLTFELTGNVEGLALVDRILGRVRTMARLLDDLLDISRITKQNFQINMEVLDIRSVVDRVCSSVETVLRTRGHQFSVSMPKHPLFVTGDATRLEQILLNLIVNAAKYTPDQGTITLKLAEQGSAILITVSDNGIGIPPQMLDRVFEPFVQINKSRKLQGVAPSLGVGLSVTKKLVELHGGVIEAYSEGVDKGSRFTVRLPLQRRLDAQRPAPERATPPRKRTAHASTLKPGKTFDILFVDDEQAIADGFRKLLERSGGHRVRVAYNGTDAIHAAEVHRPDVVILDIDLPDMSGYDVARAIRKLSDPPVLIAMSGYGQQSDKDRAREAGFSEYLVKPAGITAVTRTLSKL